MAKSCLLYYITDRSAFPGDESARQRRLLEKIGEATLAGVDYIQLREKDLSARDLESLGREALSIVNQLKTANPKLETSLLINSRTDIALAVKADGIHLRSDDLSPKEIRNIWQSGAGARPRETSPQAPIIGASCHSPTEVAQAAAHGANFAVFAPVFEKQAAPVVRAAGLKRLQEACRVGIPVLALGGIGLSNAPSCLDRGAAGIAAIRLFQENWIPEVVRILCRS